MIGARKSYPDSRPCPDCRRCDECAEFVHIDRWWMHAVGCPRRARLDHVAPILDGDR